MGPIKIKTLMNDCWDKKNVHSSFNIKGNSITKIKNDHVSAYLSHIVKKKKHANNTHILRFKMNILKSGGLSLIGIWNTKFPPVLNNYYGQTNTNSNQSYSITAHSGQKRSPTTGAYTTAATSGDVIEMRVNLKKKTISYKIGKRDCGVAFYNIDTNESYRAAVSSYYIGNKITFLSYECKK